MSASIHPLGSDSIQYRSIATGLLSMGPPGLYSSGMIPLSPMSGGGMFMSTSGPAPSLAGSHHGDSGGNQQQQPQTARGSVAIQMQPLLAADSKYKYARLNLTTNQHGEYDGSNGAPIVKSQRHISMFWQEKISILLFFLQVHALIWLQCYEFYPSQWRSYWRWTLIFILDIHNLIADSGGPSSASDTVTHTIIMLALPILSLIGYELLCRHIYADRIAGSIHEDKHRVSYLTFQKWALVYAEQLYIPVILVWFRMWTCDHNDRVVFIDSSWSCWSAGHIIALIVISAISGFFMLSMPYVIYRRMKRIVVFHDPTTHERYLQSRELEYIMGCNNLYEYTFFYYIGSFNRFWVWTRFLQLGQKLLLCLFLVALNTYNTGSGLMAQSILFLVIISGPAAVNIFYRTYRCPSSNHIKAILDASVAGQTYHSRYIENNPVSCTHCHFASAGGVCFCASVLFFTVVMDIIETSYSGFSASFIDANTFSAMLLFVNLVGLGCCGLLCGYYFMEERRAKYHGRDIYWPVRDTDLISLHQSHPEMIASLNAGKQLLEDGLTIPEEFYPRTNLLDAIHTMRTLLQEAKSRREGKLKHSTLDERYNGGGAAGAARRSRHRQLTREEELELLRSLKLGEEKSRALEWTLQDMVEDLALLYNTITARVKTMSNKDTVTTTTAGGAPGGAPLDAESSRFDRIHTAFEGFSNDLSAKSHERFLMHPLKRDFLAKMLVVKGLVTAGNPDFVYGERPPWSAPVFLPTLQEQEEAAAAAAAKAAQHAAQQAAALAGTAMSFVPVKAYEEEYKIQVQSEDIVEAAEDSKNK